MSADTFAIIASVFAIVLMLLCVYLTYKLIAVYDENALLRDLHDATTAQLSAMNSDHDSQGAYGSNARLRDLYDISKADGIPETR